MNIMALKTARLRLGLTQSEVAQLSQISLQMLQIIENGQANPSLLVLKKLGQTLGFQIEMKPSFDWNNLIAHGGPLFDTRPHFNETLKPNDVSLKAVLIQACFQIQEDQKNKVLDTRTLIATQSLLLALKINFPTRFKKWIKKNPLLKEFSNFEITGQHIKLKRIATESLRTYL